MKELPLSRGKVTIIDDEDYDRCSPYKWGLSAYGYATRATSRGGKGKTYYLHREIMQCPKGMEVDHIDGNKLNNQKSNLRICSKYENLLNRGTYKNSSTGHAGVVFNKQAGKYAAKITYNGKHIFLGYHDDIKSALLARESKAIELFGEFKRQTV